MQKIKPLFRSNYAGENVVKELRLEGGRWHPTTEYVPSAITNTQISNKAVVLGNGPSRLELAPNFLSALQNHRGGLLASGRVQTYGCNAIVRDFAPDFVVANDALASELVNGGYCDDMIIYGTAEMVLSYPGKFYLVPQNPNWDSGAVAAYLACFDGHTTVYLIGFDCHTGHTDYQFNVYAGTTGYPNLLSPTTESYFEQSLKRVMDMYPRVEFVRVTPTQEYYMPESWKYQLNLRQIAFRDFVYEVDL